MSTISRQLRALALVTVAVVLALGALAATPSSASAAPVEERDRAARAYYGALAISVDQAAGYSYDYRTKRAAKRRALNECKERSNYPGRCTVTGWVRNGCAATAVKLDADNFVWRYSFAYAYRLPRAKAKALAKLSRPRKLLVWVCTTRR